MTQDGSVRPRRGIDPAPDTDDSQAFLGRHWRPDGNDSPDAPPVPVLPPLEHPSPLGRRFSLDSLPDDWESPLPRRSATSPSRLSILSPDELDDTPPGAPAHGTAPAASGTRSHVPTAPLPGAPGVAEPPARRPSRVVLGAITAVLVVAAALALAYALGWRG